MADLKRENFGLLAKMRGYQIKKFYEEQTQWKIPNKYFHIHHIDSDRNNNDISNLVALPMQTHLRYHGLFQRYLSSLRLHLEDRTFVQHKCGDLTSPEQIDNFIAMMQEVKERYIDYYSWIEFRNFLLFISSKGELALNNYEHYYSSASKIKELRKRLGFSKGQAKKFMGIKPKLIF